MTTARGQLHPSVQKFKQFVRHHPKMTQIVRNGEKTWQQFYEEWYLLGEQDAVWNTYKENPIETKQAAVQTNVIDEEESKKDWMGQMLTFIKNMNVDQMQQHLANVTSVIGSVQQVVQSFKGGTNVPQQEQPQQPVQNNPFFFQKD
ncbi:YlbD family protein [Ectobacillus funiculus]|uniref:YlbD family protein n=1 Tax=Ectobacillus funiculus TaxID=137993 RepID=A0ABV5WPM5_9BACI